MWERARSDSGLRKFASRASLMVAVFLTLVKFAAWIGTGSVALLTSAVDALVDVGASLVTYFGVRFADRPPDRDHRFGHGKGEAVAGFTQATFMIGAAVILIIVSVERLIFPEPLSSPDLGMWVIGISLVAAGALVAMQTWVVKKTGSTAIGADRAHYLTDVAVNIAVLVAFVVTKLTGWQRADPIFALLISGYMVWNARLVALEALTQLLDQELPPEDRQRIKETVLACPGVRNIHDLRTRFAGDRIFVEFHLEVDGNLTVDRGHEIGDAAETAVAGLLPGVVEVTGHLEPFGIDDDRLDNRVKRQSTA
jgi:ferrous-iron efflux pump FieF